MLDLVAVIKSTLESCDGPSPVQSIVQFSSFFLPSSVEEDDDDESLLFDDESSSLDDESLLSRSDAI